MNGSRTTPLVSVIVPTYNSEKWITEALESAFAQHDVDIEVIVIDDGSTDNTEQVLRPWLDKISYIRQTNGGPSKARNRGIREAKGDLIAFLDADDLWLPGKLTRQLAALAAHPSAQLVHTDTIQQYESTGERVHLPRDRARFQGRCFEQFFWGNRVHTSTVLLTRKCLELAGVFDEAIRHPSTEDLDLWLRVAQNFELAYVDEPLVVYRHHETNGSLDMRRMLENEYYVLSKYSQRAAQIGSKGDIRARLAYLAYQAGYENVERDELTRGRGFFARSLEEKPIALRPLLMWASTFLPLGLRQALRRAKQRNQRRAPQRQTDDGTARDC